MLLKFISAMLSLLSGPLIESTYNIMDDNVEKDRSKLTVENYEAIGITIKAGTISIHFYL